MLRLFAGSLGFVVLLTCTAHTGVAADKNKSNQANQRDEKRENEAVRKAQDEVQEAEKAIRQAETSLNRAKQGLSKAIAERVAATKAVQKTLEGLEEKHTEGQGVRAARERHKMAQAAFDAAAEPVREKLKSDPAYQAALAEVEKAKAALKTEAGEFRLAAAKEAGAAALKVRELERAALDQDPQTKKINQQVDEALAAVKTASDRLNKAVENDPQMKSAKKAFDAARKDEEEAEAALARENRDLATARSKLVKAQQTLAQKRAADARDDNKPKKK